MTKKIIGLILSGLTGLLTGSLTTLGVSFLWWNLLPVIDRTGQGPGLPVMLLIILGILSPISIIGGLIGGAIPKEGGRKNQLIYAIIISFFLTVPFALFTLWYTGF